MLKADLHCHTKEDPHDRYIYYSARQLIDHAYNLNFDVISLTHHWYPGTSDRMFYNEKIISYAKKKGILLVPGVEARIKVSRYPIYKDVLLYNFSPGELSGINHMDDVRKIKKQHHLVVAPHPFFPHPKLISLGRKWLEKYSGVFDAVEYAYFYTEMINFNVRAVEFAKKHKKPVIGNSDVHQLRNMGSNYSLINAKPSVDSVIKAVKSGKIQLRTKPVSLYDFSTRAVPIAMETAYSIYRRINRIINKKKNL